MSATPPPRPWRTGVHPTHRAFQIRVNICQDEHGNVWSDHVFATAEDEAVAGSSQYGAVPQIAHAMLSEAVVREVYTSVLVMAGKDPTVVNRWGAASPEERKALEADVAKAALHVVTTTVPKMLVQVVPGVLTMLHDQQTEGSPESRGG